MRRTLREYLGSATQFAPLVLIFAVFYFLLIRPQQQKQKEMRGMLSALKRGDRVVTGGGILGTVQRVPMVQDKDGKQVASQRDRGRDRPEPEVTVLRETITTRDQADRGERYQAGERKGVLITGA